MRCTAIIVLLFLAPALLNAQELSYQLTKAQLARYRSGYIVDTKNDTMRGLIFVDSDTSLRFISDKMKVAVSAIGHPLRVPVIPAEYNIVRSFYRNGIFYKKCLVPPNNKAVYLGLLEKGRIELYGLIAGYSDELRTDNMTNSLFAGLPGAMAKPTESSEAEYYNIVDLYMQKPPDTALIFLPRNEKKFRDAFIPVIRDNREFVQALAGQLVEYYMARSLVHQYNELSAGKE